MLYITYGKNHTNPNDNESKRSSRCCFQGHNLRPRVTVLCTHSAISFFPSNEFFFKLYNSKRTIFTLKLCNKKYRSPCLFTRKRIFFISLSREPSRIEKSRHFVHVRSLITRKILRSRNAQCNTEKSR